MATVLTCVSWVAGAVSGAGAASATGSGVVLVGAATPNLAALSSFERAAKHHVAIYTYYRNWANFPDFDASFATTVRNRNTTPDITWEPWDPSKGVNQPTYALQRIAGGSFDTYIGRWADEIKAWGHPLVLRFAHEMNGNWYPWAAGVNGNTAAQYVAAWQHVHSIFVQHGATNVTWVWCPNVSYSGSTPISQLYPGDTYVDQVGLDGYNGGTALNWGGWLSFQQIFGASLSTMGALTTKPVVIGETASAEQGGSKAAWITDMFTQLRNNPQIVAFTWFNYNKETDWRIQSSKSATAAYAAGVSDPRYG